jgi:AraC-like DNA-binding protein
MEQQLAVTAGASRAAVQSLTIGRMTAMRFAAGVSLERHEHSQATVAVVLTGGFRGRYRDGERECPPRTVVVEPAGERHANQFGNRETTILALSLKPDGIADAVAGMARSFHFVRDPFIELQARRAVRELGRPDDVTPLALEAAGLEIVARVTRSTADDHRVAWVRAVAALLHDRYAESLTLNEIAVAVGVEPDRVARTFRRIFGEPISAYVRRIRVGMAANLLSTTSLPISQIAVEVGFADQSHLTRCFARYVGTTPGRYRSSI